MLSTPEGWTVRRTPSWITLLLGNISFTWLWGKTIYISPNLRRGTVDYEATLQHELCHAYRAISVGWTWPVRYALHVPLLLSALSCTIALPWCFSWLLLFSAIALWTLVYCAEKFPIQEEVMAKAQGLYTRWLRLGFSVLDVESAKQHMNTRGLSSPGPPYFMVFQRSRDITCRVFAKFLVLLPRKGDAQKP